jgi:ketosteroid isomerase-like protein
MSRENVEALRSVYERWSRGDFWTPEIFDPDVEVVWDPGVLDVGTYRGLAGLEQSLREFFSAWDDMRMKAEEFIDLDSGVLVLITASGRGKESSVETEGKYAHHWTMHGGKATRIVGYVDWDTPRAELGLASEAGSPDA